VLVPHCWNLRLVEELQLVSVQHLSPGQVAVPVLSLFQARSLVEAAARWSVHSWPMVASGGDLVLRQVVLGSE